MRNCRWRKDIERWFDGESPHAERVQRHVAKCTDCAAYHEGLQALRDGATETTRREEIQEAQFPAFFDGIREGIESPRRGHGRLWALASGSAAALIAAMSLIIMFGSGHTPVDATVIESYSTDLEGASITTSDSRNGVPTVWITVTQDDVW